MTYKLNVRIDLERVNDNGGFSGDRLSVDESLRLEVDGFLEVAQVLGRFHELAENIKTGGPASAMSAAADVDQAAEAEPSTTFNMPTVGGRAALATVQIPAGYGFCYICGVKPLSTDGRGCSHA